MVSSVCVTHVVSEAKKAKHFMIRPPLPPFTPGSYNWKASKALFNAQWMLDILDTLYLPTCLWMSWPLFIIGEQAHNHFRLITVITGRGRILSDCVMCDMLHI